MTKLHSSITLTFFLVLLSLYPAIPARGNLARTTSQAVTATPDFVLTVQPSTLVVHPGFVANITVTLTSLTGLGNSFFLSTTGHNWTYFYSYLAKTELSVSPNQSNSTTLVIADTYYTPISYLSLGCCHNLTITAYAPFLPHPGSYSASLTVNETPGNPGFGITPHDTRVTVGAGSSVKTNLTITSFLYEGNFTGYLTLERSPNPYHRIIYLPDNSSDLSVSFSPARVYLSPQSPTANATMTITAAQSTLPGNYTILPAGLSGVTLYCGNLFLCQPITVTVTLNGPYFTIALAPQFVINTGTPEDVNATITSVNGYAGKITTAMKFDRTSPYTVAGPLLYEGFTGRNVTIVAGESVNVILTFQSSSGCQPQGADTYIFTVTNGTFTRTRQIAVSSTIYPDFTVTSPYTPFSTVLFVKPGSTWSGNVTLRSCNGFGGPITLGARLDPRYVSWNFKNDTDISLTPAAVTLYPGTPVNATLTVKVNSDAFQGFGFINNTASSSDLDRWSTTDLDIAGELNLTSASPLSLIQGSTGSTEVTLETNFAHAFNFSINTPSGITTTIAPGNLTIPRGVRTGSLTLTATASQSLAPGTYNITVTTSAGKGYFGPGYGKEYRSVTIPVTVTSPKVNNLPLTLSPLQIAGISAVVIVLGLVVTIVIVRRVQKPKTQPPPTAAPSPPN